MASEGEAGVLDGVVVRERTCPGCGAAVRERTARWCGSCGAPLAPTSDDLAPSPRSPRWRRALVGAGAAAVVTAFVAAGGGLVDRAARPATVDDAAVAGPAADALDDLPRGRPPEPTRTAEPTCSQGPHLGCFAWAIEHGDGRQLHGSAVVAAGYVLTVHPTTGGLVAYDLHDGSPAWAAAGDGSPDGSPSLQIVEGLVLHHADGALVARDLRSGEERWRNAELGAFGVHAAHRHGDVVLLAGHQPSPPPAGGIAPGAATAAVDAVTGQLVWHHSGDAVALASEGIGVLLEDGRLRSYDAAGARSWDVDAGTGSQPGGSIWITGQVIAVQSGVELPHLRLLQDGEPLPFAAEPLASDATETLVIEIEPAGEGGGYTHGDEWVLLDGTGEVWRTPAVEQLCFGPVRFTARTITLTGCDGGSVVLDRADGTLRSQTPEDRDGRGAAFLGYSAGPYELVRGAGGAGSDDLVVVDARTDTEVARLPSETWPVEHAGDRRWELGHDGLLVLQSRGWLVALDVRTDEGGTAGEAAEGG